MRSEKTNKKEWYKHGWGLVAAILLFPYFIIWFAWAKSKWNKVVKIAVSASMVLVLILVFVAMATVDERVENSNETLKSDSKNKAEKPKNDKDKSTSVKKSKDKRSLSESDAENFCQDDNLTPILTGNSKYSEIKMIDMWNYNKNYTETGSYDKSGYPIMMLTWNGKEGNETLAFNCDVSGAKENPELHYLSMSGETMRGSSGYKVYDKNGDIQK